MEPQERKRRCTLRSLFCFCDPGMAMEGRKVYSQRAVCVHHDEIAVPTFPLSTEWETEAVREWFQTLHPEKAKLFLSSLPVQQNQCFHGGFQTCISKTDHFSWNYTFPFKFIPFLILHLFSRNLCRFQSTTRECEKAIFYFHKPILFSSAD